MDSDFWTARLAAAKRQFTIQNHHTSHLGPVKDMSSLLCQVLNFPGSDVEEISKSIVSNVEESSLKSPTPQHIWKSSFDPSLSSEEREKRMRQATGRAVFLQDLMIWIDVDVVECTVSYYSLQEYLQEAPSAPKMPIFVDIKKMVRGPADRPWYWVIAYHGCEDAFGGRSYWGESSSIHC
ncbi:Drought induced 19/ RING finger protein 114 [Artemisia annua]|uniref:Drought induced 19/ RING finger protein 114 n=1 Tax=Artemisia annua TaxID=35608 RepID=A0A2U1PQQ5_ARTAN|nr:Drought induced 19/ RING finger protein 114 [Artemisia annua]